MGKTQTTASPDSEARYTHTDAPGLWRPAATSVHPKTGAQLVTMVSVQNAERQQTLPLSAFTRFYRIHRED